MAQAPFTLSRSKLETFLACQRRFQLRYLRRLPWPPLPLGDRSEETLARGQQFHQLLEQHFLGLPVEPSMIGDERVRHWWGAFQRCGLTFPEGRPLTEISPTIPVGGLLLNGRFDLIILGKDHHKPFAHIFDWKTGRARSAADLRGDWQTRLYLAMLAAGGQALAANAQLILPENIAITYWYVTEPDAPQTIRYDATWHRQNWAEIEALVAQIDTVLAADLWPLADDWERCRACAYQVYCGRQQAGSTVSDQDVDEEEREMEWLLEPDIP